MPDLPRLVSWSKMSILPVGVVAVWLWCAAASLGPVVALIGGLSNHRWLDVGVAAALAVAIMMIG